VAEELSLARDTAVHFNRLLADYQASVKREAPVPAGASLDFVPAPPHDR